MANVRKTPGMPAPNSLRWLIAPVRAASARRPLRQEALILVSGPNRCAGGGLLRRRRHRSLLRLPGGGIGPGLSRNVRQAYRFIRDNWEPGDELFIF
jgi:hypothetical protein